MMTRPSFQPRHPSGSGGLRGRGERGEPWEWASGNCQPCRVPEPSEAWACGLQAPRQGMGPPAPPRALPAPEPRALWTWLTEGCTRLPGLSCLA